MSIRIQAKLVPDVSSLRSLSARLVPIVPYTVKLVSNVSEVKIVPDVKNVTAVQEFKDKSNTLRSNL
jgi:hypothetical protein